MDRRRFLQGSSAGLASLTIGSVAKAVASQRVRVGLLARVGGHQRSIVFLHRIQTLRSLPSPRSTLRDWQAVEKACSCCSRNQSCWQYRPVCFRSLLIRRYALLSTPRAFL